MSDAGRDTPSRPDNVAAPVAIPPLPAEPDIQVGRHLFAPPMRVDLDIGDADLDRLFAIVTRAWKVIGEAEPFESVLYAPAFKLETIAPYEAFFYDSGKSDLDMIRAFFARSRNKLKRVRSIMEIGCGVGRVTHHLARAFERVVAVDISGEHLARAKTKIDKEGLGNVDFRKIVQPADYASLPRCDLIFSNIVLQHDPPPVIAFILKTLMERLNDGGFLLVQVPTFIHGYAFDLARYLAAVPDDVALSAEPMKSIEMHPVPQPEMHRLLREGGIRLLECIEDRSAMTPAVQSMIFFGRKKGKRVALEASAEAGSD